jgi:hypothetical protein
MFSLINPKFAESSQTMDMTTEPAVLGTMLWTTMELDVHVATIFDGPSPNRFICQGGGGMERVEGKGA